MTDQFQERFLLGRGYSRKSWVPVGHCLSLQFLGQGYVSDITFFVELKKKENLLLSYWVLFLNHPWDKAVTRKLFMCKGEMEFPLLSYIWFVEVLRTDHRPSYRWLLHSWASAPGSSANFFIRFFVLLKVKNSYILIFRRFPFHFFNVRKNNFN